MAKNDPPDGTGPPETGRAGRGRRGARATDGIWRRLSGEDTAESPTGEIPAVPNGQAAPESGIDTGTLPQVVSDSDAQLPGQADWMELARLQAEHTTRQDQQSVAWTPGRADDDLEIDLTSSPALVRPYARTGGRTRPVRDLDLEALVRTTLAGKEASTGPWLNPEHTSIIQMCTGTVSVAEIAARLAVPLGVARVIIADMMDLGLVEVMKTAAAEGDERDPDFLRRVLSGLQRL